MYPIKEVSIQIQRNPSPNTRIMSHKFVVRPLYVGTIENSRIRGRSGRADFQWVGGVSLLNGLEVG